MSAVDNHISSPDPIQESLQELGFPPPAGKVAENLPPGGGKGTVPHFLTFSSLINTVTRTYRWTYDEARQDSDSNAVAIRRDPTIMEAVRTRQMPTAQLAWHLEPQNPSDSAQVEAASKLTDVINQIPRFQQFRMHLLEALWFGRYAVSNTYRWDYSSGERRLTLADFRPINGDKLIFKWSGQTGVLVHQQYPGSWQITDRGRAHFFSPEEREQLVVHQHEPEDADYFEPYFGGAIHGIGIRGRVYWFWWLKTKVWTWLMDYLERVGAGGFTIYFYEAGSDSSRAEVTAAAQTQITNNTILFPRYKDGSTGGPGIQRIDPTNAGAVLLQNLITSYFDVTIRRYILGLNISSESKGMTLGNGPADLDAGTFGRIIKYDAINLAETFNSDLIPVLAKYNTPGIPTPKFCFDIDKPNSEEFMKAAQIFFELGGQLDEDEVRGVLGLARPEPGHTVLAKMPAVSPAGVGALPAGVPSVGPAGPEGPNPGIRPNGQPGPEEAEADKDVPILFQRRSGRFRYAASLTPDSELSRIAGEYHPSAQEPVPYLPLNPEAGKKVARVYETLPHAPNDPKVQKAYEAFKRETLQQFNHLRNRGYRFTPWTKEGQPYQNSKERRNDLLQNKHLYFFTGGDFPKDHLLAQPTGVEINGQPLTHNDIFRAVHDVLGHGIYGNQFGPRGEEHAYRVHSRMYSPEARPAMAMETRGQNSWVNFGPHSGLPVQQRPYAEQKNNVLPPSLLGDSFTIETDHPQTAPGSAESSDSDRSGGLNQIRFGAEESGQIGPLPGRSPDVEMIRHAVDFWHMPPESQGVPEGRKPTDVIDQWEWDHPYRVGGDVFVNSSYFGPSVLRMVPTDLPQGEQEHRKPHIVESYREHIKAHRRLLHPLFIVKKGGQYVVDDGHHKLDAARLEGLKEVPAFVSLRRLADPPERHKYEKTSVGSSESLTPKSSTSESTPLPSLKLLSSLENAPTPEHKQKIVQGLFKEAGVTPTPVSARSFSGLATTKQVGQVLEHLQSSRIPLARLHPHLSASDRKELEAAEHLSSAMNEVNYQMSRGDKSGVGWYKKDVKYATQGLQYWIEHDPKFKSVRSTFYPGSTNDILMKTLTGILSRQERPIPNIQLAAKILSAGVQANPKNPFLGIPLRNPNSVNEEGLHAAWSHTNPGPMIDRFQSIIRKFGSEGAAHWLLSEHSISDLRKIKPKFDPPLGKNRDYIGAYVFGPKVGAFIGNLNGQYHHVTVDLWFTRSLGRWVGKLLSPHSKSGIQDQPSKKARALLTDIATRVGQKTDLDPAEVQAVLWKFEQDLWESLGAPVVHQTYADGVNHVLQEKGLLEDFKNHLRRSEGNGRPSRKGRSNDNPRSVPTDTRRGSGRSRYSASGGRSDRRDSSGRRPGLIRFASVQTVPPPSPTPSTPGSAPSTGPEDQTPETSESGYSFFTPNTEEGLTFEQALARSRSSNQSAFRSIADNVLQTVGVKDFQTFNAVGDWSDGAENSVVQVVKGNHNPETLNYAAAWYGLLGNQKSVLTFSSKGQGPDSVYQIPVQETDLKKVREDLDNLGIRFRTLVPVSGGTNVIVVDQGRALRPSVAKFAEKYDASVREAHGTANIIGGGSTRSAARRSYRKLIRAYEASQPVHNRFRPVHSDPTRYARPKAPVPRRKGLRVKAPAQGAIVRGVYYPGGKFVPKEARPFAVPQTSVGYESKPRKLKPRTRSINHRKYAAGSSGLQELSSYEPEVETIADAPDLYSTHFKVGSTPFMFGALQSNKPGEWHLGFGRPEENDQMFYAPAHDSSVSPFEVLGKVGHSVHRFLRAKKPRSVIFLGAKSDKGRIPLYNRLAKQLANLGSYRLETKDHPRHREYILTRHVQ